MVATKNKQQPRVALQTSRITDIKLTRYTMPLTDLRAKQVGEKGRAISFDVCGQEVHADQRFYDSLYSRYGISDRFFKYFKTEEVFDRISQGDDDEGITVTVDETINNKPILLSVVNHNKNLPEVSNIIHALREGGIDIDSFRADLSAAQKDKNLERLVITGNGIPSGKGKMLTAEPYFPTAGTSNINDYLDIPKVTYCRGIMRVVADPKVTNDFSANNDQFMGKYVLDIPLDGYGTPATYLALLRLVCVNLSIGLQKAFKANINLDKEKDYVEAVQRALEGFNDDEGYDLIRKCVKRAGESYASMNDADTAYQLLVQMHNKGFIIDPGTGEPLAPVGAEPDLDVEEKAAPTDFSQISSPVLRRFREMLGDLTKEYGIAHYGALSQSRKRILPVACTVYDLFNFMTEVGTHYVNVEGQRRIQAYVGTMLANDGFDLEGSKTKYETFRELFMSNDRAQRALQSAK